MATDNELLSDIYRASRVGAETLDNLISKTKNSEIQEELKREKKVYRDFQDKTFKEIRSRNEYPKPVKKAQIKMSKMGIEMNTMFDKSQSHIADIVIQGNNMGVVKGTKLLHDGDELDSTVRSILSDFISLQQQNIDSLKRYL